LECSDEIQLVEFIAQRRACDDPDPEIACSDARALVRGVRNALLTAMPLWIALAGRSSRVALN
jgi:hypothetical protein